MFMMDNWNAMSSGRDIACDQSTCRMGAYDVGVLFTDGSVKSSDYPQRRGRSDLTHRRTKVCDGIVESGALEHTEDELVASCRNLSREMKKLNRHTSIRGQHFDDMQH